MMRIDVPGVQWGESLRWDDQRQRLYYVDCAVQTLHWLEGGQPPLRTMSFSSMPTGIALTDGPDVLVCLDDGINLVDADEGTVRLLASYPSGMHGRANDMTADPDGGVVTGTLTMEPGPGSAWRFSSSAGWAQFDDDTGNFNGPVFVDDETLLVGDTVAEVVNGYSWPEPVGRRTVVDYRALWGGAPDGACGDDSGGVWSCVLSVGKLARLQGDGATDVVDLPIRNPSDACFGGADLDRLFVTSIALGDGSDDAGRLLAFDDLASGVPERRFTL